MPQHRGDFFLGLGLDERVGNPEPPAGLAEGTRLRDRVGSLGEASVEGGRLRLTLPPGSSGVFVP